MQSESVEQLRRRLKSESDAVRKSVREIVDANYKTTTYSRKRMAPLVAKPFRPRRKRSAGVDKLAEKDARPPWWQLKEMEEEGLA